MLGTENTIKGIAVLVLPVLFFSCTETIKPFPNNINLNNHQSFYKGTFLIDRYHILNVEEIDIESITEYPISQNLTDKNFQTTKWLLIKNDTIVAKSVSYVLNNQAIHCSLDDKPFFIELRDNIKKEDYFFCGFYLLANKNKGERSYDYFMLFSQSEGVLYKFTMNW